MYAPLNYKEINIIEGSYAPSMVKTCNTKVYDFWTRALFQRACSTLSIDVMPEWEGNVKDFLFYCLFKRGYVAITKNSEYGLFFNPCSLKGQDLYYQPTNAIIANKALKMNLDLVIGKECELLRLTPDYMGLWDVISYYAEKLSSLDSAINMSIINNRMAYVLAARNKTAGIALQKMLDKINKGEPAVIWDMKVLNDPTDKAEPWQYIERTNLKSSYLTTDQLMDFQTILNNFDSEIGIPTIPYQKKERLVTSEAESRTIDSTSRSLIWFETLTSSIKKIKELYPEFKMDVKLRYKIEQEDESNGNDDINRNV